MFLFFFLLHVCVVSVVYYVSPGSKSGDCLTISSPCSLEEAMSKSVGLVDPVEISFSSGVYEFEEHDSYYTNNINLTFIGKRNKVTFKTNGVPETSPLLSFETQNFQIINIDFIQFERILLVSQTKMEVKIISCNFKGFQTLFQADVSEISKVNLHNVYVEDCIHSPFMVMESQGSSFDLTITNSTFSNGYGVLGMSTGNDVSISISDSILSNLSLSFDLGQSESKSSLLSVKISDSTIQNSSHIFFSTNIVGDVEISLEGCRVSGNLNGLFQLLSKSTTNIIVHRTIFQSNVLQRSLFSVESELGKGIYFNSSRSTYFDNKCPELIMDKDSGGAEKPAAICISGGVLHLYGTPSNGESVYVSFVRDEISKNIINTKNFGTIFFSELVVANEKKKKKKGETFDLYLNFENCNITQNMAAGSSMGGVVAIEQRSNLYLSMTKCIVEDNLSNCGGVFYIHGVSSTGDTIVDISDTSFARNRVRYDVLGLMLNQGGVLFFVNDLAPPPEIMRKGSDEHEILKNVVVNVGKMEEESSSSVKPKLRIFISKCEFYDSQAVVGGAISVHGYESDTLASELLIEDSQFLGNKACYYGGVVFALKIKLNVSRQSIFWGNSASSENGCKEFPYEVITYGGVFVTMKSDVTYEDSELAFSSTEHNGGSLSSFDDDSVVLKNTQVWKSEAGIGGGCFFYSGQGKLVTDALTQFRDGKAQYGGGLLVDITDPDVRDLQMESIVEYGDAALCGGGIYYSSASPSLPPVNLTVNNRADNGENYLTRPFSFKVDDGGGRHTNPCTSLPESKKLGRFECELKTVEFYDAYGQKLEYPSFYPFQMTIRFGQHPTKKINTNEIEGITFYVDVDLSGKKSADIGLIRVGGDTMLRKADFVFPEAKKSVGSVFLTYWWILLIVLALFVCFICCILGMVCCQHRLKNILLAKRRKNKEYIYLQ